MDTPQIEIREQASEFHRSFELSGPTLKRVVTVTVRHWRGNKSIEINWSGCGNKNLAITKEFLALMQRAAEIAEMEGK